METDHGLGVAANTTDPENGARPHLCGRAPAHA